jgi:adenylate cyclase
MADAASAARTCTRLRIRYGIGIASAQLFAAIEVIIVAMSLRGRTVTEVAVLFGQRNVVPMASLIALAIAAALAGGTANLEPSLRWYVSGQPPDSAGRRGAMTIPVRQSAILLASWLIGGAIFTGLNLDAGFQGAVLIGFAAVFGGVAAACDALVRTQRTVRPLAAAAQSYDGPDPGRIAAGLVTRLVLMWILCGVLPCAGITLMMLARSYGWILKGMASVEVPMLVFSLAALPIGLRVVALVSRSIRDPVGEVVAAMSQVERGQIGASVDVYDRAEIGRLQNGFNRMMLGLSERDVLRDLFGRYVGEDVASRAVMQQEWPSGDVQEVAILFIDLTGFTHLAATRRPDEVADVLNAFFRIVVGAVDERHGLINKFQGDAALAVFGAPLQTNSSASAAMSTARVLGPALRELVEIDFGIGVSAGPVFAGNVGAESRYEYTVIGDAVNEASRLADHAKTSKWRILCSQAVFDSADSQERHHWVAAGSTVLRGRVTPTQLLTLADE